ncbi:hypothetical protein [Cellulomonas palmilytica]|uniref:hypothetical protein n=1 Tax=Cellulomonas palmilytica TaxID=2608402 RepID=UPI001F47C460|nr:hypothetical protein [Cellulomonas palmilytica]UJP40094.1 hypothetical protein F1D97_00605 [Cellulomonas palmilytica]
MRGERAAPERQGYVRLAVVLGTCWAVTSLIYAITTEEPLLYSLAMLAMVSLAGAFWVVVLSRQGRRHRAQTADAQRLARERGWLFAARDDSVLDGLTGPPRVTEPYATRDLAVDVTRTLRLLPVDVPGTPERDGATAVELETVTYTYRYVAQRPGGIPLSADLQVVAVRLPADLPRTEVMPEAFGRSVLGARGRRGLELGVPEFDTRYVVDAEEPRVAWDLLTGGLARRLVDPDLLLGLPWVVEGGWILTWHDPRFLRSATIDHCLHLLDTVLAFVPPHVWQDARTEVGRV